MGGHPTTNRLIRGKTYRKPEVFTQNYRGGPLSLNGESCSWNHSTFFSDNPLPQQTCPTYCLPSSNLTAMESGPYSSIIYLLWWYSLVMFNYWRVISNIIAHTWSIAWILKGFLYRSAPSDMGAALRLVTPRPARIGCWWPTRRVWSWKICRPRRWGVGRWRSVQMGCPTWIPWGRRGEQRGLGIYGVYTHNIYLYIDLYYSLHMILIPYCL